jgi:hypothetical protein
MYNQITRNGFEWAIFHLGERNMPDLSSLHDFCVAGEKAAEEYPTVVKEGWHVSLEEAQEADSVASGQYMGEENARSLGADVDEVRRTVRKAKSLLHLWSRTKKLEKPLDFGAAYREALL